MHEALAAIAAKANRIGNRHKNEGNRETDRESNLNLSQLAGTESANSGNGDFRFAKIGF